MMHPENGYKKPALPGEYPKKSGFLYLILTSHLKHNTKAPEKQGNTPGKAKKKPAEGRKEKRMVDMQIFANADFGSIRTIEQDGKVLFCGRDIAAALGYTNPIKALADHCKGVPIRYPLQTPGGIQEVRFIAEGDVYRLITHSRLPAAEQFERWVFDEVLPTIRRTGSYTMPAAHAKHIAYLQSLQREVKEWRGLVDDYTEMTTSARQLYERNRATRDRCRAEVSKLERQIDDAILVLGAM